VPEAGDALAALPASARARLERFSAALERVGVAELALYAIRPREPRHEQAREAAAEIARERRLEPALDAARQSIVGYVARAYREAGLRLSYFGPSPSAGYGVTDERVLVMRSLGDAVTAVALGDALDEDAQAELLGAWDALVE
jgi:hypothetical protein